MKKIDRRSFLRTTGLATAGLLTAPYVGYSESLNSKTEPDRSSGPKTDGDWYDLKIMGGR